MNSRFGSWTVTASRTRKGSNAGFFVWVDLFAPLASQIGREKSETERWKLEEELQSTLLAHKVFLARGAAFGGDVPGWFRIVFAHQKDYLEEGLRRIVQAVGAYGQTLASTKGWTKGGTGNRVVLGEKHRESAKL